MSARVRIVLPFLILAIHPLLLSACSAGPEERAGAEIPADLASAGYAGSATCRECHEAFYELWAPSHHGLAVRPYTEDLGRTALAPQEKEIPVGGVSYRALLDGAGGRVVAGEAGEERAYPIAYALGGKNLFYFLTPMERGSLQLLPLAYDVRQGEWFDATSGVIRHMSGGGMESPDWRAPEYRFSTSCHACHVSQIEPNYDLETDTYWSTWTEPGIGCESCHGPCAEHVRACRQAAGGEPPGDLRIVRTKAFGVSETNELCGSCHAKRIPITARFDPDGRFFDQFDLLALEHEDFHPDGRDIGENYTYTGWLLSPCVSSGELDCLHCHTSSGRFRQAGSPDEACSPCHAERVADPVSHTRHPAGSDGSRCVSCHMPATRLARMVRHDHSLRPPMPSATLAFGSPNACNICHRQKPAEWADGMVRQWHGKDYQAATLRWAGLVGAARAGDWKRLPEMLEAITAGDRNEVVAASLIRLVRRCEDEEAKRPALEKALGDPSPLVRAAAAGALGDALAAGSIAPLARMARDESRLVRIRAAGALSRVPPQSTELAEDQEAVRRATDELLVSFMSRPDDAESHHDLGTFHLGRGDAGSAVREFEITSRLRPERAAPLINAANAYLMQGRRDLAEARLRKAISLSPASGMPKYNLGVVLAEGGRREEAEQLLRAALEAEPDLAGAAYNLAVLLSDSNLSEAIRWSRRAAELRPGDARYAYNAAFYLRRAGQLAECERILSDMIGRFPGFADAYGLLAAVYEETGRPGKAREVYRLAASAEALPPGLRTRFAARLEEPSTAP